MEPSGSRTPRRTAIFGGSFNPPHISHVLACQFALCAWDLDRIVVIPAYRHAFAKELAPYEDRCEMTHLAFRHLAPHVEVSRIEEELGGVSYTIDTLAELKRREPHNTYHLLLGSDLLAETSKWKDFDRLAAAAPPLVIPRLSLERTAEMPQAGEDERGGFFLPAISSSGIREILAKGGDPGLAVPRRVAEYIRRRGLYRAEQS